MRRCIRLILRGPPRASAPTNLRLSRVQLITDPGDLVFDALHRGAAETGALFGAGGKVNVRIEVFPEELAVRLIGIYRQLIEREALLDALGDERAGDLIGAAKRHALFHQIIREVGRIDEPSW